MKAGVLYSKKDIRYEEIEDVNIQNDDEVKVNVKICGICGSDIPRVNKGKAHYFPIVLGHEFSGVVSEVGKNVKTVKVGDKVSVAPLIPCMKCRDCKKGNYSLCKNYVFIGSRIQGGFAEYVIVNEKNIVKIDKSLSFEEGAMLEPSTVALHGIKCAKYKKGKNVLLIGCGTIGAFTLQWLKIIGCKKLVTLVRSEKAKKLALELGSDYVFLSTDENIQEQIDKVTLKCGFDYVFDAVGSEQTIKDCLKYVGNKGTIMLIGTPTTDVSFTIKQWELINRKECTLSGSWMSYSSVFPGEEWTRSAEEFKNKRLVLKKEMINNIYPLKDIDKAFEEFDTSKVSGRTLIKIEE